MASSSSSATIPRYDVFLSFRGEDTRNGFTSHLYEALSSSHISTFIDDSLRRGEYISPSLLTAIEKSMISVIIFSQDYANSRWCLKELMKIFQCKHLNGQIVIPVFYGVDPSHVRKQTGKFGLAFDKLKERLPEGEMDLNEVRSHLKEAANISGWNSHDISPESELIKCIVGDILKKLNQMALNLPSNLVGIGLHIERVEALLCLKSPQFRTVGLWGMGGIGKTTVAQTVYRRICNTFDGFCFVEKVSEKLKNQSVDDLREKIVLKLFEEERLNMGSRTLRPDFIMKQLRRKKVLIVLDDVYDAFKAKILLAGENDLLFSGGSRILVTSRDKQVLENIVGDQNQIYEVNGLSKEDGLQLFSLGAFKQNHPTNDRLELSERVLSYAGGNPLALVVLGCALFDKSKEEWVSALDELGEKPFLGIQKVLRISYDDLCDEEKMIFLDIARFLVGKTLDFVVQYYKGSVKRIEDKINNLVNKSLITISGYKRLEMHDLLKEMCRSIESAKKFEKRLQIWDLKTHVSKKRKGSLMIEAINAKLYQGQRIAKLARFLSSSKHHRANEESKVRFCWEGFRGFPELRYLRWDSYPQKSLPSIFCFENLVGLQIPNSAIRKLWTGKQHMEVKECEEIEEIVMESENDGHGELPSLTTVILCCLPKLRRIRNDWWNDRSLKNPPPITDSKMSDCSLVEFPIFTRTSHASVSATNEREPLGENLLPQETPEIFYGDHSGFEIKLTGMELSELPKAEEWEKSKLIHLNDSQLLKLPENPRCPVLEDLSLKGNSKLRTIPPSFFNQMPALRVLDLSRTRIKSLPESLFSLPELKRLFLKHCNLLMKLSPKVGQLKGLQVLDLEGTEIMNLPEEVKELENLMCLKVSFCELPSYRRVEEPDVLMISPGTLSALPLLEELSINVSPDDGRWNECVESVVYEVSRLAWLYKLQFYFPSMEFLSHFQWSRFKAFKLTAGHLAAKRLMPRLPSDAEAELERYDKSFTSVHGDFESEKNNPVLQHADALFLDRHTTMKTLSMFGLDSFKHIRCCVVGECNELQVLFCVGQPPHVSLEYLYLYYMKSLRSIWEGNVAPHAFLNLKSLTLRTCPLLSSIFTSDSIGILKSLREIIIDDCPAITTLVSCYTAHNFLPSLKRMSLHYLPRLNGIFDLSLSRDLEWMSIYHCPNLKSLPIDTASNENLKKIMGERSWWESLEWQDTKQHSWDDVFVEQELCY